MGVHCSRPLNQVEQPASTSSPDGLLDPFMHQLEQRSIEYTTGERPSLQGQLYLLHKYQKARLSSSSSSNAGASYSSSVSKYNKQEQSQYQHHHPTRLVIRRRQNRACEEGMSGTHIYAVRYPADQPLKREMVPPQQASEQAPPRPLPRSEARPRPTQPAQATNQTHYSSSFPLAPSTTIIVSGGFSNSTSGSTKSDDKKGLPALSLDHLFARETMLSPPKTKIKDWVAVNDEHKIYIADVGLSTAQCDLLVQITESVCRGQYAAYTYAKQTLGCREFPALAQACQEAVHTMVHAIIDFSGTTQLLLDDREPHMVKYDDTKRERQKLDMHTDKSEWTFLISLSDGSGLDYDGGGTYFECIDATVHVQRGHALVFPGKLRHCGQRITKGLRFLLVGFLVDKGVMPVMSTLPGPNAVSDGAVPGAGASNPGNKTTSAADSAIGKLAA